jgi:intracellular septation protein
MKLLFDLFPIILFFVAFKIKGIYVATGVAIVASIVQILYTYIRHRKVDTMLWVSLAVIVVFGGATLLLHNEMFIKWKPTVLYGIFSGTLLISNRFFKKNLIQAMLGAQMKLADATWRTLNFSWGLFFAGMAILNLVVAYNFSTSTWVNYKLFGTMGLMFGFILIQSVLLAPQMEKEKNKTSTDVAEQ